MHPPRRPAPIGRDKGAALWRPVVDGVFFVADDAFFRVDALYQAPRCVTLLLPETPPITT